MYAIWSDLAPLQTTLSTVMDTEPTSTYTREEIIEMLREAGFGIRFDDAHLFVYLKNRPVHTSEVVEVLNFRADKLRRKNDELEISI